MNDTDDLEVPILYSSEDKPIQVYHHHGPWIILTILLVISIVFNIYLLHRHVKQLKSVNVNDGIYLDNPGEYINGYGWGGWLLIPDYAHQPNWIEEN